MYSSLRDLLPDASRRARIGEVVKVQNVLRAVNVYLDQRLLGARRHDAYAKSYRDGVVTIACRVAPAIPMLKREERFLREHLARTLPEAPFSRLLVTFERSTPDEIETPPQDGVIE